MAYRWIRGLTLILAAGAEASSLNARFALHRVAVSDPVDGCGVDSPNALGISCADYSVTGSLGESYVFVVVGGLGDDGLTAVRFGADYDGRTGQFNGIDPALIAFTACNDGGLLFASDYGHGPFPNPNGQVSITFPNYDDPCYEHPAIGGHGRHALIGYFYVFAHDEDVLQLNVPGFGSPGPRPEDAFSGVDLLVVDCAGVVTDLVRELPEYGTRLGKVHFGGDGSGGYTPCGSEPVRPSTWGAIKAMYGR